MDKVAVIEWDGVEYEVEYTFELIRRLKGEGLNVPKIYRLINEDPNSAIDYLDDIAEIIAYILRWAGCKTVTPGDFFVRLRGDQEFEKTMIQFFIWVSVCHLTQSTNVPVPSKKKPKAKTTKKAKKRKS